MKTDEEITELANAVVEGDEAAMNAFVNATIDDLRAVVETQWLNDSRLKGRIAPSDIVQSTYRDFLNLCRKKESEIRDAKALLFTTAHYRVLNRVREHTNQSRDPKREVRGDDATAALRDPEPTPAELASRGEDLARLAARMAELTDEERALLLHRASTDKTWDEIAGECGGSADAIKQQYYRLLKRLKSELGGESRDA